MCTQKRNKYRFVVTIAFFSVLLFTTASIQNKTVHSQDSTEETKTNIDLSGSILFEDNFSINPEATKKWRLYKDSSNEGIWNSADQNFILNYSTRWNEFAMFADFSLPIDSWIATFRYKAGGQENCVCGDCGGDGFVFMFYKEEENYNPPGGGSLGFDGLGYGIEFDSYYNGTSCDPGTDPSGQHIAIIKDGWRNHLTYVHDHRVEDNNWHSVVVSYDHGNILLVLDNDEILKFKISDPDYSFSGVGFSSATGNASNQHIIDDFVIRNNDHAFLDLPFNYEGLSFIEAVRDDQDPKGGKIGSYFDHHYPTLCEKPNTGGTCKPGDYDTVILYGYDGLETDKNKQFPYDLNYNGHQGYDFTLSEGTDVLAAADGTVVFSGYDKDNDCAGNHVIIRHSNGYTSEYWHLGDNGLIEKGKPITRDKNKPIGHVGHTGCTQGGHLHFQVNNSNGIVVDPFSWLPQPNSTYEGKQDPWEIWNENPDNGESNAKSHYLWTSPLMLKAIMSKKESTIITSPSGMAVVEIPVNSYTNYLELRITEILLSPRINNIRTLNSFSIAGYDINGNTVLNFSENVKIQMFTNNSRNKIDATDASLLYAIQRWDNHTGEWIQLETYWDSATSSLTAYSDILGNFILTVPNYRNFIPIINK